MCDYNWKALSSSDCRESSVFPCIMKIWIITSGKFATINGINLGPPYKVYSVSHQGSWIQLRLQPLDPLAHLPTRGRLKEQWHTPNKGELLNICVSPLLWNSLGLITGWYTLNNWRIIWVCYQSLKGSSQWEVLLRSGSFTSHLEKEEKNTWKWELKDWLERKGRQGFDLKIKQASE